MHSNDATSRLKQVEQRMLDLVLHDSGVAGEAAASHLRAGGSRVRAKLALHASRALGLSERPALALAAACELLHNASLVHDDLQDRDVKRRGQDAVWRQYGEATAICAGDLMLSAAYAALAAIGPDAAALVTRTHQRVAAVIRGQCEDLSQQGGMLACLATYERIACAKSGPLLVLPLELALVLAGYPESVDSAMAAGSLFAIGYQAADDLDDVERDALNEELNIVAVLAASGEERPREVARALAIRRFTEAAAVAASLPGGCGELLAEQARTRAAALAVALEPA